MNYTYRKLRALIWTGAAIASAAAYFTADTVESGLARDRLEAEFEPGLGNIRSEVLVAANSTLYYIANRIASSGVTVSNATSKLAVELAGTYGLDEVNFADMEGVIRASTHPEQIGYYMGTDPDKTKAAGFLSLLSDMQWYDQPPRTSVQADGVYRKFCGVRLGDGLLQVGINYKRLSAEMRQHFADVCCDWAVAGDGWYILAYAATKKVVSNGDPQSNFTPGADVPAKTLYDLGFTDEMLSSGPERTFTLTTGGRRVYCRASRIPESGHIACMCLPESIMVRGRRVSVGTMTFILLSVIFTVAACALRAVTLRERAEESRSEEDRRRAKDMALAASIQATCLPGTFPPFPHLADMLDIFARMTPAREVVGDFYDFYFVGPNRIAIVIADVSGKGVPAAMFMMRAKATINDGLSSDAKPLNEIVADVNGQLASGNEANMFVTSWIGVVDVETGELEYVNCGHLPPVLRSHTGALRTLDETSGPALAAIEGVPYSSEKFKLSPGDTLYLYTDGVTESRSKTDMFGDARMMSAIEKSGPTARDVCDSVTEAVDSFSSGTPQADDITMLALVFNGAKKTFAATTDGLRAATEHLRGFCGDPDAAIVIDEIASNIVRYSGAATFDVEYLFANGRFKLVFSDSGRAFNPLEAPEPDVNAPEEERSIGGLGIFLVKRMSESLDYRREGGRNILTVVLAPKCSSL